MRNNNMNTMKHTEKEDYDNTATNSATNGRTQPDTYHTEIGVQFACKARDAKTTTRNNNHDNPSIR